MLAIDIAGHVGSVNDQGTGSYGMFKYTIARDNSAHSGTLRTGTHTPHTMRINYTHCG